MSAVDESLVTSESIPVAKRAESRLVGGTLNGTACWSCAPSAWGRDALAQIVRMVAEAQRSRAPIQRLADVVSAWFVPAVITTAVLAAVAWYAVGPEPRLAHALVAAVSVLIVACPCALGLATPMSIMVGTGRGAQAGVLVRNAEALETLERVDTLVVDKTGTLTQGRPRLTVAEPEPPWDASTLLRIAASLERASEHPPAAAVVARRRARHRPHAARRRGRARGGVSGRVDGTRSCSARRFLRERGASTSGVDQRVEQLRADGQTLVVVAIDGRYAGLPR